MFLKQFLSVKMTTALIIAVSSLTKQKTADLTLGNYPTKNSIQKTKTKKSTTDQPYSSDTF